MVATAIAQFGSSVRGDSDRSSDKDLLVVSDSANTSRMVANHYTKFGWEVSQYSFDSLACMSRNGSLFVRHLQLESESVYDVDGRLRDILNMWTRSNSYRSTAESTQSLCTLLNAVPDTPNGTMFAADLIWTVFRGIAIPMLAEIGIDVFAPQSIALQVRRVSGASRKISVEDTLNFIRICRFIKRSYRSGLLLNSVTTNLISRLASTANLLLGDHAFDGLRFCSEQYSSAVSDVSGSAAYSRLRWIERMLCSAANLQRNASEDTRIARGKLRYYVANPAYSTNRLVCNFEFDNLIKSANLTL